MALHFSSWDNGAPAPPLLAMAKKTSLLQFLMRSGAFNKSHEAEQAIRQGRIKVSKQVILNPKHFINPKTALIFFDAKRLIPIKRIYLIMNKPKGVICQKSREEKSIYGFLDHTPLSSEQKASLFAVGRLDKDTEGLLIITNDGDLSNLLMSPDTQVPKTYEVVSQSPLRPDDIARLEAGVIIRVDDLPHKTEPAKIEKTGDRTFRITITEGKKNQIKLMLKANQNEVIHLKRISIGNLNMGSMQVGEIRQMTKQELLSSCLPNEDKH